MATKPEIVKTFHTLTVWWADKVEKGEKLVLTNEDCHLTYNVANSAVHIEWSEFDKDKPAFTVRRMTIPLYNIKFIDEIIEGDE